MGPRCIEEVNWVLSISPHQPNWVVDGQGLIHWRNLCSSPIIVLLLECSVGEDTRIIPHVKYSSHKCWYEWSFESFWGDYILVTKEVWSRSSPLIYSRQNNFLKKFKKKKIVHALMRWTFLSLPSHRKHTKKKKPTFMIHVVEEIPLVYGQKDLNLGE